MPNSIVRYCHQGRSTVCVLIDHVFSRIPGTFMSIAHISFSFARPLDRLHRVRPLRSVFHLALFVSLIGQVLIHLGVMVYITNLAKVGGGRHDDRILFKMKIFPHFWKKMAVSMGREIWGVI